MQLASAFAVLLAGWLIGATGIGGVLVVPALVQFENMPVATAISASALAFAFPGVAALWWLRGGPPADRARLLALVGGAVPGAMLGAWGVHQVDPRWLLGGLAVLALASGLRGLRSPPAAEGDAPALGPIAMTVLGFAVGAGSALTGTGGPVLVVPLLLLLRQPMPVVLPAAQAIQLPVALCASAAHAAAGALDLRLGIALGLLLLVASLAGQWAGRRIPVAALHRIVCLLLVATGGWFGWRALN
jgi:uncharacterized membrane protein YfcA